MNEFPLSGPRERSVFVLGRRATLDVEVTARAAARAGAHLVLLSVGYPVSAHQQRVVDEALGLASKLRLWLDAVLVTSPEQLVDFVRRADDLTIIAAGRERKRIEHVLGPKLGPAAPTSLDGAGADWAAMKHSACVEPAELARQRLPRG